LSRISSAISSTGTEAQYFLKASSLFMMVPGRG
jgi:hypothetical protein